MTPPLRVLLVEDDETDAKLVVRELTKAGRAVTSKRVDAAEGLRAALAEGEWDIVISDWTIPGFGAREAMQVLAAAGLDLPIIIVSGTVDEEIAVDAMRAGARDFVLKGRLSRLGPAVDREVSERAARATSRRTEQALKLSEIRFNRLSESGVVGIALADLAEGTFDANDACLEMIGVTRKELRAGAVRWDVLTPTEGATVNRPFEKELVRKDGTRVSLLIAVAILDDDRHCLAVISDLTDRKRAEHDLAHSQDQLRQAQKLEALGRLAGGVAHDFNNLLTVILSYAAQLTQDLEDGDLKDSAAEITQAGERASVLTRQLLAFSRRQMVLPRRLELDDALGRMDKLLRRLIGEDVELRLQPGAQGSVISVDPGGLEQVVMNLAVNARDAMPTGGTLTFETAPVALDAAFAAAHPGVVPGPHVLLRVADSGTGMSAAVQARIFEPFFTTKEANKGTGLGLSTVLGIVQQSGATIWVDSAPGKGTRFSLYFPVVTGGSAADEGPRDTAATLRGTETVLVVEDDVALREVVLGVLRRNGYDVLIADSSGDAVILSEQHAARIHLLLTDVVMPRLGGRQLAERLVAQRPDLRVLYMSGYTDDEVLRHGVREQKVAFLAKPFTPEGLLRKVREVLG